MAFDPRGLTALATTDTFTLWLYTTDDTRAAVLAPGYFAGAASRLLPGHVLVLQSADSLTFLPVRSSGGVGNGLVLDASAPPLRLNGFSAPRYAFALAAVFPAVRSVALDPVPTGLYIGRSFTVSARTTGPVATLQFRILNAAGATVAGPTSVTVASGTGSVTFTAPDPGTGYRIRVQDAAEPLAAQTSATFVVTEPLALLTEQGFTMIGENDGELHL
jgi:hypothetical protein